MRAIYRKELNQMFHSMIGYIYLASFLLIGGIYFVMYQLIPANEDISKFFSQLMSTVIFLLPMLTMRSYAEERRMKTESLLMSAPVSALAIALGKFFAVLTVFAIGLSFTILYVICLAVFGQFEPLVVLGNYVGMIAATSSFLAIGLLISMLTENQIIACIITYSVLLVLWLIGMAGTYVVNPVLKTLIHHLSMANRFAEFSMGIFDISTMVYYLSITVFVLFLISVITENRRQG